MAGSASGLRAQHSIFSPCCPLRAPAAIALHERPRYDVAAFVLAGGVGARLGALTGERPKPLLPFAGHHRLIDFTLSNAANSGLPTVGVLTQYLSSTITEYLGDGAPWGYTTRSAHLHALPSSPGNRYSGTANAVQQHLGDQPFAGAKTVLILAADHVYRMDYQRFLDEHARSGADLSIAVLDVPREDARRFGVVQTDARGDVVQFVEKPANPESTLASMGIYACDTACLRQLLAIDANQTDSEHDFGHDVLPLALRLGLRVHAYTFEGFWRDVGTPEAYWAAQRDVLLDAAGTGLESMFEPLCNSRPAIQYIDFGAEARVNASVVAGGCSVQGTVERSLLSPGVHVARGAVVRDSVLLANARVEEGAIVEHAILDEYSRVGRYALVGAIGAARMPDVDATSGPVSVIGARARIQPGRVVTRGTAVPPVPHTRADVDLEPAFVA